MEDEREVRPGFLPPKAPGGGAPPRFRPPAAPLQPPASPATPSQVTPPQAPAAGADERPVFVAQRMEAGPRSPLALTGTIIGSIALLLLLLTVGFAAGVTGLMSIVALLCGLVARKQIQQRGVGRAGEARAAIWVGAIGILLAVLALIVIAALDVTQTDLQRWLEDQIEEQRMRRREDAAA